MKIDDSPLPTARDLSELSYRRLFEAAQDGILMLEVETGRITDVNPFLTKLLGFTREEMVGKTVGEMSPFKDLVSNQATLEKLKREGYVRYHDLPLETKAGEKIAVEFVSNIYQDGDHKVIQCNIRDLTDRKQTAAALLESKRFLSSTLDALSSHIAILDGQGIIIEVNAAWKRFADANCFVGSQRGVGDNYLAICDTATGDFSEEASAVVTGIRAVINGEREEFHFEYPCHGPTERRWFIVRVTHFNSDGPVRVVVAHENITERKLAEEQLNWKTALLEAQLESSLDGIVVVGLHGEQVLKNRRLPEVWKIPPALAASNDETAQLAYAARQTKNPDGFLARVDFLYAHPEAVGQDEIELLDGTILDRYSAPVRDKQDQHYGRIWSFRDVTERRKMEQRFYQAQKMESIGQLAGGIAHDFNNILAAIVGNIYLAKLEAPENSPLCEYLESVTFAAKRAAELINQILTFSRNSKQERLPIELNNVVLEALKLLRASVPATIKIQTELTKTPSVLANASAIHQIIMNLGTNAWHAMNGQPGKLKVEMEVVDLSDDFAETHTGLSPGRYVRLSLTDTGCGIAPATLTRIFDPFFTTKPVGQGTGLGLAVVQGIMKSHDGGIFVYSELGVGTKFHLYFPVVETAAVLQEMELKPISLGHGEHLLFVDDETVLATLGKRVLEKLGYVVTSKTSALEALVAFREQPGQFQLVLTDLTMPEVDGLKLCSELHRIQPELPVILMTGYSGNMTATKIQQLGFRELLNKPMTPQTLGESVARVLLAGVPPRIN